MRVVCVHGADLNMYANQADDDDDDDANRQDLQGNSALMMMMMQTGKICKETQH
jgi:hypothetical protein